jgi:hypothetical protein
VVEELQLSKKKRLKRRKVDRQNGLRLKSGLKWLAYKSGDQECAGAVCVFYSLQLGVRDQDPLAWEQNSVWVIKNGCA